MSETGSKLSQMVEEEATRAEAESPETDEPTPEPETTPEPGPSPEPEEEEAEADAEPETPQGLSAEQASELEKATTAYVRRVGKAFGGELPPECPHCNGLGFDLSGGDKPPDFSPHEQYRVCPDCDGLGNVLTGSQVPGHILHECPKCVGRGYLEKLPQVTTSNGPQGPEYGTPSWMGDVQPNVGIPG